MADEVLGSGSVVITLDESAADSSLRDLADRIERVLDRASRDAGRRMQRNIRAAVRAISPVSIRVEADLRAFGHSIDTLQNFDPITLPVDPDVDRARFEAAIEAVLAGLEVRVRVVPDFDDFDAAIRAHNAPPVHVDVVADDRSIGRFTGALGKLGGAVGSLGKIAGVGLGVAGLGIAAAGATSAVVGLAAALAPLAGLLAAAPAVALGAGAAFGTLKLALSGVGEAFTAGLTGDAAAFSKALEGLSPKAQAAAQEVRALKPAFEALKTTVQDGFFEQIEGEITATADAVGGVLTPALTHISTAWGLAAKGALDFVQSSRGVSDIEDILNASALGVEGLSEGTNALAAGFLNIAGAVAKAFGPQLSSGISNATTGFGEFLTKAADSGQAVAWVQGAIDVLQQLGGIATNVGSILAGVFRAAQEAGGGFLGGLQQLTGTMAEFVRSAEGQSALVSIFTTLSEVASQLGPILKSLVTNVGGIAAGIAPILGTLGPAIVTALDAIGPAIEAILPGVQAVATGLTGAISAIASSGALESVGAAFSEILSAIAPLLPVIGQLVAAVGTALAPVLSGLAGALAPVVQALSGALLPILPTITGAFTSLATALAPVLALLGNTLGQVIGAAAPLLTSLANIFVMIADALGPIVQQFVGAFIPVIQQMVPLIGQLVAAVGPLVEQLVAALLPVLPPIIEAFLAVQTALLGILPPIISLAVALAPFVSLIISALAPVLQFAAGVVAWQAMNVVVPVIQTIVTVIGGIISAVASALTAVSGFVGSVIGFFSNLRGNVVASVSALVAGVVNFFAGLPGRARGAVSGLVAAIGGVFQSARDAAFARVRSLVTTVLGVLRALPGQARAALGGVGSALVSAGADLMRGFINGVKSMAGALASAAKSAVSGAVSGAKSLLGIASPSKVFIEIGKFVGQGFIKGLQGTESDIKQAAQQVIGKIRDAFKGKNTRLDDRLIAQVKRTEKELISAARRREAIAAKIKKANELAASVTQNALATGSLQNFGKASNVQGITDGIEAAIAKIKTFNNQVNDLAKRGLRKDLLAQLIGLGPDQGAGLAKKLTTATDAQLEELNEAQKQLTAASKKLGQDSADKLFDAGKQASKGFLAGLKAQQKDVEDLMLTLARGMAKAIKSALGIKSPSRVFRSIGHHTMRGLELGLDDRMSDVRRSVLGASEAITEPFGRGGSLGAVDVTGSRQRATQARTEANAARTVRQGRTVTVAQGAITVNEVGDASATAERILQRLVTAGGL